MPGTQLSPPAYQGRTLPTEPSLQLESYHLILSLSNVVRINVIMVQCFCSILQLGKVALGPGVYPNSEPLSGAASDASSPLVDVPSTSLSFLKQLFGCAISGVMWAAGPVENSCILGKRMQGTLLYWGNMLFFSSKHKPMSGRLYPH